MVDGRGILPDAGSCTTTPPAEQPPDDTPTPDVTTPEQLGIDEVRESLEGQVRD